MKQKLLNINREHYVIKAHLQNKFNKKKGAYKNKCEKHGNGKYKKELSKKRDKYKENGNFSQYCKKNRKNAFNLVL